MSKSLADLNTQTFYSAMDLMPHITEGLGIPYETPRCQPPSYDQIGAKRQGRQPSPMETLTSTREELRYAVATSALELGFNALTFDGS